MAPSDLNNRNFAQNLSHSRNITGKTAIVSPIRQKMPHSQTHHIPSDVLKTIPRIKIFNSCCHLLLMRLISPESQVCSAWHTAKQHSTTMTKPILEIPRRTENDAINVLFKKKVKDFCLNNHQSANHNFDPQRIVHKYMYAVIKQQTKFTLH